MSQAESSPALPNGPAITVSGPQRAGRSRRAWLIFALTAAAILAADLAIKYWSFANVAGRPIRLQTMEPGTPLPYHESQVVIPHVLSLRLTTNTGAVFGIGKGGQIIFVLVGLIAAGVILRTFWTSHRRAWPLHVALAMILGGAVGNLYDRLRFAAVRDMFWLFEGVHLPFGLTWFGGSRDLYPWLFNLADAALLLGVGLLIVMLSFFDKQSRTAGKARG